MSAWDGSVRLLATMGGLSVLPYRLVPHEKWKGGGLLGSLAAWGVLWALPGAGPWPWVLTLLLILLSIPISGRAERLLGSHDDPRIIIDEAAGVWLACLGLPRETWPMAAGLALFRVFDVFKGPWGRAAARLPGGWGVVADDLLAGLIANGLVRLGTLLIG